jgi:hypothetical protein
VTAAAPSFPEAALRAVLAGVVAAWARSGVSSAGDEPRRWYVDAFAGAEFAFGAGVARGAGDETRAAAALRALEGDVTAVLVDEDPAYLQRIYAELEDAVGGERLRGTRDLASLAPGEVTLVESPFAAVSGDVARVTGDGRAFAFLAPPTARALTWDAIRPLASAADATLLVRLPFSDFEKQSRHTGPVADLPGFAKRIVEGCSALLGDARHAWLPAFREAAATGGASAAMSCVVERFSALLADAAPGRIVKPMMLETGDGACAWLFLVTADPAVAMAANAAVRAAGLRDRAAAADPLPMSVDAGEDRSGDRGSPATSAPAGDEPEIAAKATGPKKRGRPKRSPAGPAAASEATPAAADQPEDLASRAESVSDAAPSVADGTSGEPGASNHSRAASPPSPPSPASTTKRPPPPPRPASRAPVAEALDLFPIEPPEQEILDRHRPDAAAIAATLEDRFRGRTVAWQDVLRAFAATDITPDELKKALALLRRGGRAIYRALKANGDEIDFPAEPAAPPPKPARPRRRSAATDGGLFEDEEPGS